METRSSNGLGHSAEVRINLAVNGFIFSVAELGPQHVVLRQAIDHAPTEAEITMTIDGYKKQWRVELVEGIVASRAITKIQSVRSELNGSVNH